MTLGEMVERMSKEMAEEAAKNEKKGALVEELDEIMKTFADGYKVDGCKLFDWAHKFNKAFPEYTSAIIAMSFIASFGVNADLVEFGDVTSLDVDDIITGLNIDGEED